MLEMVLNLYKFLLVLKHLEHGQILTRFSLEFVISLMCPVHFKDYIFRHTNNRVPNSKLKTGFQKKLTQIKKYGSK